MSKLKSILFFAVFTGLHTLRAQSVSLDLPAHRNGEVTLQLSTGVRQDTIFRGRLNGEGRLRIAVPPAYRNYKGMAAVVAPAVNGAYFQLIVADGENMTLRCPDSLPHVDNVTFLNSPENQAAQKWFSEQGTRMQKLGLLSELAGLYNPKDNFFATVAKEKQKYETAQATFEQQMKKSPLYVARLVELDHFASRVAGLPGADSLQKAAVRKYLTDSLDVAALYTSGLWFNVLNGSLVLYDNKSPYHYEFVHDMSKLLRRANDSVYASLAENLFTICESTGWSDLEEELAYFLINDGRIKNPTGKLQMLMTLFKLQKGSKVPSLLQGELPAGKKTVLIFYETGCGNCENEMQQLKGNYPLLQKKGYEVVSVSADNDSLVFRNTAKTFPWHLKYCDFKGFASPDFQNFGVIGTPTIYVIDEKGILKGRYARMADTGLLKE